MRVALTAGGTGGHILPAMAVLDALEALAPSLEVAFFGPEDRGERAIVEARGVHFEPVPAAGIRGRGPVRLAKACWSLASGTVIALRKLRAFRPDAVFSTGGYASFPTSVAARLLRRPLVVYLPDVTPGWAVRAEKRLATRIATTTDAALRRLPAAKTTVTGYPVRREFFTLDRAAARASLGIAPNEPVLLVAGASQGSRHVNAAVVQALDSLAGRATVIHVTGAADLATAERARAHLQPEAQARYLPSGYREDMPAAMLAADLAVVRAGASVLGELPAAGLPAILVPGTFAGGHQRDNARWLAGHGAALILEEADLAELPRRAIELLENRPRLDAMSAAARALARPNAARDIAGIIVEVAR